MPNDRAYREDLTDAYCVNNSLVTLFAPGLYRMPILNTHHVDSNKDMPKSIVFLNKVGQYDVICLPVLVEYVVSKHIDGEGLQIAVISDPIQKAEFYQDLYYDETIKAFKPYTDEGQLIDGGKWIIGQISFDVPKKYKSVRMGGILNKI